MYEVLLESKSRQDLKKLPSEKFHRVVNAIQALGKSPFPIGCRKIVGSKNDWRIRVGDYRVIYEVDKKAKK